LQITSTSETLSAEIGALRTLRPQDTSAPIFGAEVSRTLTGAEVSEDTSAPVPKCLKTLREGVAGQQQANRT